jgi:hypothetical protein
MLKVSGADMEIKSRCNLISITLVAGFYTSKTVHVHLLAIEWKAMMATLTAQILFQLDPLMTRMHEDELLHWFFMNVIETSSKHLLQINFAISISTAQVLSVCIVGA